MTGDDLVVMLAALANPLRLRIIARLAGRRDYVSHLAREIGVSRNAVIGKANRLGLSRFKKGVDRAPGQTGTGKNRNVAAKHRTLRTLWAKPQVAPAEAGDSISRPLLHMHLQRLEAAGLITGTLELSEDGKAMKYYEVADFDLHLTAATLAAAAETLNSEDPERGPGSKEKS